VITPTEREEIISKGKEDGARLFKVAEGIYKGLIILNWIGGIVGVILAIVCFSEGAGMGIPMGLGVLIATAICCIIDYVFAVLMTHGAKVLVHILFANLAIMEEK
jgi:hypothetical protein